jgi:16S rRNA (guanine527-N7)-methyltransferase
LIRNLAIKRCVLGKTPDILDCVPIQLATVAAALEDFGISLGLRQMEQIASYMDLLTRWNRAINLTSILDPGEVIRRHFAESIYITRFVDLRGAILDVGSGAGFPGLAIKIARPELRVVLLEPVAKKRAFLKEVVRECKLDEVEVSGCRVEDYSAQALGGFESATVRAVGNLPVILRATGRCLKPSGSVYLWLAGDEGPQYALDGSGYGGLFRWSEPTPLPMSRDRKIWRGRLIADC